jgi:hypothetical protein
LSLRIDAFNKIRWLVVVIRCHVWHSFGISSLLVGGTIVCCARTYVKNEKK